MKNFNKYIMKTKHIIPVVLSFLFLSSCVAPKIYKDEKERRIDCEKQSEELQKANKDLSENYNELKAEFEKVKSDYDKKLSQQSANEAKYNDLKEQYDKLRSLYDNLLEQTKNRMKQDDAESKALLASIQKMQQDLQEREDKLHELENTLSEKKQNLDLLQTELEQKNKDLQEKQKRIAELQRMLAAKDSASKALKKKISDALLGFEGNGLHVERKNGKVYVSMDEQLLFKTGSDKVNPRGVKAIKKIAEVLAKNPDINILVEGHTDDVGDANYNWDLSVKRATSVVKIMTENKELDPKRITAAGHGEFMPVEVGTTPEIRAKNRRTEIILEPNYSQIMELLNQ